MKMEVTGLLIPIVIILLFLGLWKFFELCMMVI